MFHLAGSEILEFRSLWLQVCSQFSLAGNFFFTVAMGKQYISTNSVDNAHSLDILDVAITNKYTVTVSSDGYAKFWDNKLDEVVNPKEHVHEEFIDKSGVHHVNVYENILADSHKRIVILGYGCFGGSIVLQFYVDDDISTLKTITDIPEEIAKLSWIPIFYKDPESVQDYLIVTQVSGNIYLYDVIIKEDTIEFEKHAELIPKESLFPNAVDVSQTIDKKLAVGYTNGEVLLYNLDNLKILYTFRSTDLLVSGNDKSSNSIPRVVKFSPGGSIIAVARDNQNAGSINLYDVQYGENVGSLTKPSHSSSSAVGGFAHEGWIMGLSFDYEGKLLASCGFDKVVRIWNLEDKEREATINLSISDFDNTDADEADTSVASGVEFIKKGIRGGLGGDNNDGLCVISFDRGVRWYREAGGI